MTSSRKKPGAAFRATVVVVVLLVAYPLSFGPGALGVPAAGRAGYLVCSRLC